MSSILEKYAIEFCAIVKHLKKCSEAKISGSHLLIEKETVVKLLKKNAYDTAMSKLKIWKALNWIVTDGDRLTVRALDRESKKQKPYLKLCLRVSETLERLNEK